MKDSFHVALWTSCHWLILLLLLMLTADMSWMMPHSQCMNMLTEAEKQFYSDPEHCKTTCLDQMLIAHGHGMKHKTMFVQNWLQDHLVPQASCPFLSRSSSAFNSSHTHRHMRRRRQIHDLCNAPVVACNASYPYRELDGLCNNLAHPFWGFAAGPQRRLLPAVYDDGKSAPRTKDTRRNPLPSARAISNCIHKAGHKMKFHDRYSGMVIQFGQFLAHDVTLTGMASLPDGEALRCCGVDKTNMKIITGRQRVLTEEPPRLTTMDDNNTLAVFAGYYTRSLFPLPAFLNDVEGIHPGLIKLNEIKTPVLEFFLTCIERDSLCYNIIVSSQELSCRHKPISNSKLTDPSASSGSPHSQEMTDTQPGLNPECFPITFNFTDRYFPGGCIDLARSDFVDDCNGVRDQLNFQTAYIDASQIFGANEADRQLLWNPTTGKLKESSGKSLVYDETDSGCDVDANDVEATKCFLSGDIRVNEQPGLVGMHTLWMREFNRIVGELHDLNPVWDPEQLYQTARKIVGAQMQHVVYNEWLPAVLGRDTMRRHRLSLNQHGLFEDPYDPTVDASVFNAFSTAVLRFGHSGLHQMVGQLGSNYEQVAVMPLDETFFKTKYIHEHEKEHGSSNILRWHCLTPSPMSDRMMEDTVRNRLFPDERGDALDLASLNIQRGRDHGLPSYNKFREFCGLPKAYHFGTGRYGLVDFEPEVACLLEKVYKSPDDIDLWTALVSEKRHYSEMLGPTLRCLMVEQFKRFKEGDRFWYERNDPVTGFTLDQLNEIRKVTMSRIMCDCTDSTAMLRNVFWRQTKRSHFNRMYSCNDPRIRKMDLSKWKE